MNKHEIWEMALNQLRERIHSSAFTLWFSDTTALSLREGVLVVEVTTTFAKAHLEARYLDMIRTTVTEIVGTPVEVQLMVSHERFLANDLLPVPINLTFHEVGIGKFLLVISQEESGYKASVPDVPGCFALGRTREEAIYTVRGTLQAYLATLRNDHETLPEPRTTAEYLLLPLSLNQGEGASHMRKESLLITSSAPHCSFCDTPQDQIASLTAGPGGLHICNECVDLCREIILESRRSIVA